MSTPKKRPKFRRAWAWAWTIAAIPVTLIYLVFRFIAKLIAHALRLSLFFAPRCKSDEELSNPVSDWIEDVFFNMES